MTIKTDIQNKEAIVQVIGRIDTTNFNEFESGMNELLKKQVKNILLDCTGLDYISSSGLRVFLTTKKAANSFGGNFCLYALQPGIREIFDISGFSSIFSISPDLKTAKQQMI
jgi:anti-anti-sigma factor